MPRWDVAPGVCVTCSVWVLLQKKETRCGLGRARHPALGFRDGLVKVKRMRVAGGKVGAASIHAQASVSTVRGCGLGSGVEWKLGRCHDPGKAVGTASVVTVSWLREDHVVEARTGAAFALMGPLWGAAGGAVPGRWEPHLGGP